MSSSKKKRRRSSLAPAKIVPALSPARGLCSQIDGSLPPEERLEQLSLLCLKLALEKVSQESSSPGLKENTENVKEDILNKVRNSKPHKEAVLAACHAPDRLLPNPDNLEMGEIIKLMENRINKLQQEEEEWNSFLKVLEQQAKDIEGRTDLGLVLTPMDLTEEQRTLAEQYLPELSDLNSIRQQKDTALQNICMMAWEHEKNLHTLEMRQLQISKQLDAAFRQLDERSFPQMNSPKASLQHLIEFPTPPAEPH